MLKVEPRHQKESFESLMRRFSRLVDQENILQTYREKEFFEKPSVARKRAKSLAKKRWEKRFRETNPTLFE